MVAAVFAVGPYLVAWQWMWLLAVTLFAGLKLLTVLRLNAGERRALSPARLAGYLLLWPGMRPQPFFRGAEMANLAVTPLLASGARNLALGAVLLWLLPHAWLAALPTWAHAWIGLVGIALVLHLGFFALLAAAWRRRGIPVEPLFLQPTRSGSVAEFWGRRWNRAFSDFSRDLILRPLSRRMSTRAAGFVVFVFSGLVHDLVVSVPAGGGYGLPTLYFLLQGILILCEGTRPIRELLRRRPVFGHIWTWIVVVAPAPLLFHAPFLRHIVLPFLATVGAA
jgi:membrane bound O-acyltransferase family protein